MQTADPYALSARCLITEALLKLLANHPFDKISVRAIVQKAGISRTTFYLHFLDKYDLYDQLTEQITAELINKYGHEQDSSNPLEIESLKEQHPLPVTISIFDHVRKYAHFYRERFQDPAFVFQLSEQLSSRMKLIFRDETYAIFLAYGTVGYIGRWLKDDLKGSSHEMAKQLTGVAVSSLQQARQ